MSGFDEKMIAPIFCFSHTYRSIQLDAAVVVAVAAISWKKVTNIINQKEGKSGKIFLIVMDLYGFIPNIEINSMLDNDNH